MTWGVLITVRGFDPLDPPSERLLDGPDGERLTFPTKEQAEATARALGSLPDVTFRAVRLNPEGGLLT